VDAMSFTLERQQEADGRSNREAPELACILSSSNCAANALLKNKNIALRVIAHRLENSVSEAMSISPPFDS